MSINKEIDSLMSIYQRYHDGTWYLGSGEKKINSIFIIRHLHISQNAP